MNNVYEVRKFNKGRVIFREGSKGAEAYVVRSGTIDIHRTVDGQDILLAILGKGNIFGEMALLNDQIRTASAIASDNVELVVITKDQYAALLNNSPKIISSIVSSLIQRLDDTSSKLTTRRVYGHHEEEKIVIINDIEDEQLSNAKLSKSIVSIHDVIPGMVISEDIKISNSVMITAGTKLDKSLIKKIKEWDIDYVSVK